MHAFTPGMSLFFCDQLRQDFDRVWERLMADAKARGKFPVQGV
jgi:hypothetical protein